MHNILKKDKNLILILFCCNILVFSGYFYISDIIENRYVLMTIIVMLKFTQSLRPNLSILLLAMLLVDFSCSMA